MPVRRQMKSVPRAPRNVGFPDPNHVEHPMPVSDGGVLIGHVVTHADGMLGAYDLERNLLGVFSTVAEAAAVIPDAYAQAAGRRRAYNGRAIFAMSRKSPAKSPAPNADTGFEAKR